MVNWPSNPTDGDVHTENGQTWVWRSPPNVWDIDASAQGYVLRSGDTMTGGLTVGDPDGNPTLNIYANSQIAVVTGGNPVDGISDSSGFSVRRGSEGSNPNQKIQITSDASGNYIRSHGLSATTDKNMFVDVLSSDGSSRFAFLRNGEEVARVDARGAGTTSSYSIITLEKGNARYLQLGGAEEMTGQLVVNKSIQFDPSDAAASSHLALLNQNLETPVVGIGELGPALSFGKISSGRPASAISAIQTSADNDRLGLAFFTHEASATGDELVHQMTLTHDGQLYLGDFQDANNAVQTISGGDARYIRTDGGETQTVSNQINLTRNSAEAMLTWDRGGEFWWGTGMFSTGAYLRFLRWTMVDDGDGPEPQFVEAARIYEHDYDINNALASVGRAILTRDKADTRYLQLTGAENMTGELRLEDGLRAGDELDPDDNWLTNPTILASELVVGTYLYYTIVTAGDTAWVAAGAPDNDVGTTFLATSVPFATAGQGTCRRTDIGWVTRNSEASIINEGTGRDVALCVANKTEGGGNGYSVSMTVIAKNDKVATDLGSESYWPRAQGNYGEAIRAVDDAGNVTYAEIDVINNAKSGISTAGVGSPNLTRADDLEITQPESSMSYPPNDDYPYPFGARKQGTAYGFSIAAGGDHKVNDVLYDSDVGVTFVNNGARFKTGILFKNDAIRAKTGLTSWGEGQQSLAITMYAQQTLTWFRSSGGVTNGDASVGMNFSSGALHLGSSHGVDIDANAGSAIAFKREGTTVARIDAGGTAVVGGVTVITKEKGDALYAPAALADLLVSKGVVTQSEVDAL